MSNLASASSAGDVSSYRDGWRAGLAVGALAIAVVAFINLLSIEKSLLAAALAVIAMRGAGVGAARGRARLALGVAAVHLALAATVLILFHDKLGKLLHLLQSLG